MAGQLISGCLQLLKDMALPMISEVVEKLKSAAYEMTKEEVKEIMDVEDGVEKLGSVLTSIQAVLFDAEKRAINDASVQNWLDKLKDVSFDIDDVLDEWNTAVSKSNLEKDEKEGEDAPPPAKEVCSKFSRFSGSPILVHDLIMRHNIASKIKRLNERLDAIDVEKSRYHFSIEDIKEPERPETTSFIDVSEVYGREDEIEVLMGKLLNESRRLDIIPIVGMGGIGKTTLSQLIYNDKQVQDHFEKRIWICVSDPFDEKRVALAIIKALRRGASGCTIMQSLLEIIKESVEGKRCLFVLDDVWTDDATKWEPLKEALKTSAPGSRILVTTRKKKVAIMMGAESRMVQIKPLSEEICWSIFSRLAFSGGKGNKQLEDIGKQIVAKCKGLPLVAKTLGSLMRNKTCITQWTDVLHSELWQLKNDNGENSIFAPFLLSYNDLPSVEKRCLSYCSIFPKDYYMKKDVLIQLWMSQSYLNEGKNLEKEGEACFENLAMRSFFQDFEKDEVNGSIISCKMHDIMHDFVQSRTQKENCIIDIEDVKENMQCKEKKPRHATLLPEPRGRDNIPSSLYENKGLRTLFVASSNGNWPVDSLSLGRLFINVTTLRTLNLSGGKFQQLPQGIEKLIHLRYLDLSSTRLRELPNSLCDLFNLQVLNLFNCYLLKQLPKEIRKLVNLRHLYIDQCRSLKHLPKGIGKLSCLQTLDGFIVPDSNSLENGIEALELEDLNMLKQLQGSYLFIDNCGNLQNGSQAERVQLKDKEYLATLHLCFDGGVNRGAHEEILEALEPHPNLKDLTIRGYMGNTISPKWMMALINLKSLVLSHCQNCEFLPPLGKLPSLEYLYIDSCHRVKRVGVEFLGIENDDNAGAPRGYQISLFPKLKRLEFFGLDCWEKWELGINSGEEEDNSLVVMPSLQSLEITFCRRLTTLPDFLRKTPLQHLVIRDCQILKERCREGVGEECPKISHIPNIQLRHYESSEIEDVTTHFKDVDLFHEPEASGSLNVHDARMKKEEDREKIFHDSTQAVAEPSKIEIEEEEEEEEEDLNSDFEDGTFSYEHESSGSFDVHEADTKKEEEGDSNPRENYRETETTYSCGCLMLLSPLVDIFRHVLGRLSRSDRESHSEEPLQAVDKVLHSIMTELGEHNKRISQHLRTVMPKTSHEAQDSLETSPASRVAPSHSTAAEKDLPESPEETIKNLCSQIIEVRYQNKEILPKLRALVSTAPDVQFGELFAELTSSPSASRINDLFKDVIADEQHVQVSEEVIHSLRSHLTELRDHNQQILQFLSQDQIHLPLQTGRR